MSKKTEIFHDAIKTNKTTHKTTAGTVWQQHWHNQPL